MGPGGSSMSPADSTILSLPAAGFPGPRGKGAAKRHKCALSTESFYMDARPIEPGLPRRPALGSGRSPAPRQSREMPRTSADRSACFTFASPSGRRLRSRPDDLAKPGRGSPPQTCREDHRARLLRPTPAHPGQLRMCSGRAGFRRRRASEPERRDTLCDAAGRRTISARCCARASAREARSRAARGG